MLLLLLLLLLTYPVKLFNYFNLYYFVKQYIIYMHVNNITYIIKVHYLLFVFTGFILDRFLRTDYRGLFVFVCLSLMRWNTGEKAIT